LLVAAEEGEEDLEAVAPAPVVVVDLEQKQVFPSPQVHTSFRLVAEEWVEVLALIMEFKEQILYLIHLE
jgi:hypothetical protein